QLREKGRNSDVAYLEGFTNRKEGHHEAAIADFKKAIALGRDDVVVNRELAFLYFILNELDEANYYLERARSNDPNSRYVLDLAVQIALRKDNVQLAEERMKDLGKFDRPDHFKHRQSTVSYYKGEYERAYEEAKQSCSFDEEIIPFPFPAQVIRCEIELGLLDKALENMDKLDRDYPNLYHDQKIRIRAKYALARKKPEEADQLYSKLSDKNNVEAASLRRSILIALIARRDVGDKQRSVYQKELDQLHVDAPLLRMS